MATYTIQGKEFKTPERITNRMLIEARDLGDEWLFDIDKIGKMMKIVLEGPHDKVDWLDEEVVTCSEAYQDFFSAFRKKIAALVSGSSSD